MNTPKNNEYNNSGAAEDALNGITCGVSGLLDGLLGTSEK